MTPEQFRTARLSLGLTQVQLAQEFGMAKNGSRTIIRWESGETPVNPLAAYAIRMLTLDPGYLLRDRF